MNNQDYTVAILVKQKPEEAFNAINNATSWWTENLEGTSQNPGDEFSVRFGDVHYSKQKLVEVIPNQKVVWLITDSKLTFIKDQTEWTGTTIAFDITEEGGQTQVRFTQTGLVPQIECYNACSNAWGSYITDSLKALIETGKGGPTVK
jgi:Activator of Hsp90 ATPase homolog 1-like protein